MKNIFIAFFAFTLFAIGQTAKAQDVDLSKYTRITDLSQLEEGESYYIVNDRTKFNYETGGDGGTDGDQVQVKAMSNYQTGYTATCWDNAGSNKYFVYYGDLNTSSNGFVWKAEKVGDQWAFLNMELNKYLGNHNSGETDLRFSDTAIGYTLTKLETHDGSYGFSFTNDSYLTDYPSNPYINVHQYPLRKSRGVCAVSDWSDANATDAATYGYPGRWRLYKTTVQDAKPTIAEKMGLLRINRTSDLTEGEEYYIVSDRTAYASNSTDVPKAMSTQQSSYSVKWGTQYVYWGDIDTTQDGFVWTVEEMPGGQWAFKNKENGRYLGNMNSGETDVIFSDTPIGYTLTDLTDGAGKFTFINDESEYTLHVQGYLRSGRPNNSLAKQANGNDDYSADVAVNGYPGRWHIYVKNTTRIKSLDDITDGKTYYIVSDRKKYAASSSESLRAMSTLQSNYTTSWGTNYVYWGEMAKNEDGFKWTAEKVGTQWAFKNVENNRYIGNMNSGETDVIFSDTPIGYTLTDLTDGAGKFTMISDEDTHSLHVQGYLRSNRANNSLAKNYVGDDDYSSDVATSGYPGRWHLYEVNTVSTPEPPTYDKYHFDTINVVSYNIKHCEGQDGVLNVQRTANAITALNPNVAVLQEVDMVYGSRSNYEDQLATLAKLTGMYGRATPGLNFGTAILSKEKPLSFYSVDFGQGSPMPVIELQDYVVGCVHIALSVSARNAAGPKIVEEAQKWQAKGKPFIVAGDFNDDGTEEEMQGQWGILTKYLQEHGFTFHSDMVTPTWGEGTYVIDHIISYDGIGGVKTLSYQVIDDKVTSDHLPIVAQLRVGFPKPLTPAEVRALIQESVNDGNTSIDMSELAFDTDVTAADLQADGNILVIAPETSTLTGTNIINNGVCDNLLLTDGKPFVAPQPFTAATATYSRNVTSRFGTICMPFPISSDANTKYYTLDKIEGSTLYLK